MVKQKIHLGTKGESVHCRPFMVMVKYMFRPLLKSLNDTWHT